MSIGSGSPTIINNILDSNDTALRLNSAGGNIINNTITNSTTGVEAFGTNYAYVAQNNISSNSTGARINSSSYANLYYNNINNNTNGAYISSFSINPNFTANAISNNTSGIYAQGPFQAVGNQVIANDNGINLSNAYDASLKNNNISSNSKGILANQSSFYSIGNNISANTEGINLSSSDAKIYSSSLTNASTNVTSTSSSSNIYNSSINNASVGVELKGSSTANIWASNIITNATGIMAIDTATANMSYDNIYGNTTGINTKALANATIHESNIYANSSKNIVNETTLLNPLDPSSNINEVDATNNFWNTLDEATIKSSTSGRVNIGGFQDKSFSLDFSSVDVISYNIVKEQDSQGKYLRNSFVDSATYKESKDPSLDAKQSAVYGFQEVPQNRHNEFLNDIFAHSSYENGVAYNSTVVSSEAAIANKETSTYNIDGSSDGSRSLQKTTVQLGSKQISIFNTHLPTDRNYETEKNDVPRAYGVLSGAGGMIDKVINTSGPVIFTADTNNHYWAIGGGFESYDTTTLDKDPIPNNPNPTKIYEWNVEEDQFKQLKNLEANGFTYGKYQSNSYNGFGTNPYTNDPTNPRSWVGIDYIFYRDLNSNQQVNAEVMTQYSQSDHWPVKANLKL